MKLSKFINEYDLLGYDFKGNKRIRIWKNPNFSGRAGKEIQKANYNEDGIRVVIDKNGDLFMGEYNIYGVNDYDHDDLMNAVNFESKGFRRGWINRNLEIKLASFPPDIGEIEEAKKKNPLLTGWKLEKRL